MLIFNDVEIQLSITAKINKCWPDTVTIASNENVNFVISSSNSDKAAYTAYPGKTVYDPVQRMSVGSHLCPQLRFNEDQIFPTTGSLYLYENGFVLFILSITTTQMNVKQINTLINRSLKEELFVYGNRVCSFKQIADNVINTAYNDVFPNENADLKFFEAFSIIHPQEILPHDAFSDDVVGSEYEVELYEAAIRRMPDLSEARIEVARGEQKNASSYKGDLIYLNYHNLLVYVVPNKRHIQPQLYIDFVYLFKVYIANLSQIQSEITEQFSKISSVPGKLRKLREESNWLDKIRLEYMRATESFEATIDVAAVRISWFNSSAQVKFGISKKQERILTQTSHT